MAKKNSATATMQPATPPANPGNGSESRSSDLVDLLREMDRLLQEGQPATALSLAARAGVRSPWVTNALAVCQLRAGAADRAVETLRGLVLAPVGVALRDDVPAVFKTNYATAQMVAGNITLGLDALGAVHDETNPAVQRLRAAVRRWHDGLTFWQKVNWWMGGHPDRPMALDFPAGDLE